MRDLTDLIARAWEQERAKYGILGLDPFYVCVADDEGQPIRTQPPLFAGTMAECVDKLYALCAAAVEKALADAGYVVVPKEPTEAMLDAGIKAVAKQIEIFDEEVFVSLESGGAAYRAMIAAR